VSFREYFSELCKTAGIELSEEQVEKFEKYLQLLKKWNRVHNLTAIKEDKEIALRHFCDSLSLIIFFKDIGYNPVGKSLVDIGTGAGFPGVPLKIYYRDLELHLVESVTKKCAFLNQLKIQLKEDFKVHCTMAENLNLKTHIAVARALEVKGKRKKPTLYAYELLSKFATELLVIMKGKQIKEGEIKALPLKIYEFKKEPFKGMKLLYQFIG
jgi:16S rRNA (guanine527-N7)-methyltransferase